MTTKKKLYENGNGNENKREEKKEKNHYSVHI